MVTLVVPDDEAVSRIRSWPVRPPQSSFIGQLLATSRWPSQGRRQPRNQEPEPCRRSSVRIFELPDVRNAVREGHSGLVDAHC